MSTNKTPNYNLHSWLPQDEFHVSEINENFTGLDTRLAALDASLNAETAALSQQVAAKAEASAVRALQTAVVKKAELVTGSYVGNATLNRIDLGRKPVMVHIEIYNGARSNSFVYGGLYGQGNAASYGVTLEDTGFSLSNNSYNMNSKGATYYYVAYFQ